MNKAYLTLNSLKQKGSPKKNNCQEITVVNLEKLSPNSVVDFSKIKETSEAIKIKKDLIKKKQSQKFPSFLQDIKFTPTYIKPLQSPRIKCAQTENFIESKQLLKYGCFPQQPNCLTPKRILKKIKQLKELKQTISTNSSNKSVKAMKINDFQIGKDLGKGKFGNVKIARHKKTGMLFSIKIIKKQMVRQDDIVEQLIKQTKIQSFLNHSHVVKLYSVFDDIQNVYLLMELCCEGNLYQYMQKRGKIPEIQASQFMKQTCQAVKQLHSHNIIHRDIKPQNIVLCFGMLKICDFGWSTEIKGTLRQTFCGSPLYISPELLKGQMYDEKVDLWSLGILAYEMMAGTIPFQIVTQRDLIKIVKSQIVYPNWMSSEAISFLQQLLQNNPENRSSIDQLMSHPFINKNKTS